MKKKVTREIELQSFKWIPSIESTIYFDLRDGQGWHTLELPLEHVQAVIKIAEYILSKCD